MDYYVISVAHTQRQHRYITFWCPDDKGYCWPLSWAGRYPEDRVRERLGYYNSGCSNIAVPCSVIDAITVPPVKGDIDNDAGPVVLNNRTNWEKILRNVIAPTQYPSRPTYKGARLTKEEKEFA